MRRRFFLASTTGALLDTLFPGGSWGAQIPERATNGPRRTTTIAERLEKISKERREAFFQNAEGKTAAELNAKIPEIDAIEVLNTASDAPERNPLRVIAWNMERGRHWREGVKLIREHPALQDPDVLFLGEMDFGMARSSNEHTAREMAAELGMNYAYGVEFLELTKGEPQERTQYRGENEWGYHGNAILCRYPLHNVRMLRFPGIEKWFGDFQKRLGGRMALFATIQLRQTVTLVATHLESAREDFVAREREMGMILRELGETAGDTPVILGGDLNAAPTEAAVQKIKGEGFTVEESNNLAIGTRQQIKNGELVLLHPHIDYICAKGVSVVREEPLLKVIRAAYPIGPSGKMLGDHAVVTARVQVS